MYLLKMIERNLRRNLRRSVLTALTVALATFIYVVLASVPSSMDRIVKDASSTLRLIVVNRSLPFYGIPGRYCDQVREMPGCAACVAITGWPATYRDVSDQILAVAEGQQIVDVFPDYDLSGEARRAWDRQRRGAFAGRVLMARYGWHTGDQVTLRGVDRDHLALSFVILGEMHSARYPNVFAFRRDYLEQARKAISHPDPDLAWNLVVRVHGVENVDTLIKEIDDNFRNSDYETRTLTESDALAGGLSALGDIRGIVFALCAIVILTVLIIAAMLFGECGAIGLAGGTLAAAAALWIFSGGASLTIVGGIGALWVTPTGAAKALGIAIAVCILSGVAPIWTAVRLSPKDALRKVV